MLLMLLREHHRYAYAMNKALSKLQSRQSSLYAAQLGQARALTLLVSALGANCVHYSGRPVVWSLKVGQPNQGPCSKAVLSWNPPTGSWASAAPGHRPGARHSCRCMQCCASLAVVEYILLCQAGWYTMLVGHVQIKLSAIRLPGSTFDAGYPAGAICCEADRVGVP